MAVFETVDVNIKLSDFEEIKQILDDFKIAMQLIAMYQLEIRNCSEIPEGFCQGEIFREKLATFNKYCEM